MPFQKKTTATVESVAGAAALSLTRSLLELKTGLTQFEALSSKLEELGLQIAQKEDRIRELSTEFVEKERQLNVNLQIQLKENSKLAVLEILQSEGLISVDKIKQDALLAQVFDLHSTFEDRVKAEKGKAEGIASANYTNREKLLTAEHATKEANNLARISQLEQQVAFLKEQSTKWEVALGEERKASVDRAKAASVGTINVGTAETRR
jgi:hypothetical protein